MVIYLLFYTTNGLDLKKGVGGLAADLKSVPKLITTCSVTMVYVSRLRFV